MWETIETFLQSNGLAQGGLFVLLSGSILGVIYKSYAKVLGFIIHIFTTQIGAIEYQESFYYLQKFIETIPFNISCSHYLARSYTYDELSPYYGTHYFWYKKRLYRLSYQVETEKMYRRECINILTFSMFKKSTIIKEILDHGKFLYENEPYLKTKIWIPNETSWLHTNDKKITNKPILDTKNKYEELKKDIYDFTKSEDYYNDNNFNYRRGYLFYGEPGNGKTTCIISLAQDCKKHLCMLNLANTKLTENTLVQLISNMPSNTWLCLEDIDTAAVVKQRTEEDAKNQKISLGTVLNILDGPHTPHGLVVFMTTNHIEKLDKALIRPGRIDVKYEFTNTNEYQANELFSRMISANGHPERGNWVAQLINKPMSESQVKLFDFRQKERLVLDSERVRGTI